MSESSPADAFEMMVWERLYAALLSRKAMPTDGAAEEADKAFEQWKRRHVRMAERFKDGRDQD